VIVIEVAPGATPIERMDVTVADVEVCVREHPAAVTVKPIKAESVEGVARGLDPELVAKLGAESCNKSGGEWIRIPYFEGQSIDELLRTEPAPDLAPHRAGGGGEGAMRG
jgi:hypothetical protein